MQFTEAGKDLRSLSPNVRQFVRVEPGDREDRRRDLGALDRRNTFDVVDGRFSEARVIRVRS